MSTTERNTSIFLIQEEKNNNNNKNIEKVHAVFGKLLINIFQHEELHIKA